MSDNYHNTNDDCKKCCCSMVVDISSDYEEHGWQCTKGHYIEGVLDENKKGCCLSPGKFYIAVESGGSE